MVDGEVLVSGVDLEKEVKNFLKNPVEEAIKKIGVQALKSKDGTSMVSVQTMLDIGVHVTVTIEAKKEKKNG